MHEFTDETRQTYDVIAPEYARRNSTTDPRLLDDLGSMTDGLAPGSLVADVGCGPGLEIALIRRRGYRVIGLDLSYGQLRAGGLTCVAQADMRQLPLRTGSVDAVWCQAALLHLPREAVPTVLDQFARVIRPGGRLFVAVAEGSGEGWEAATNYGSDRRRWFTYHSAPDLTALLGAAGFEVRQVQRTITHRKWLSLHSIRVRR